MSRKPVVYVSRITNLSDARYCAGMGVDMLGFVIDPADPDFVSPVQYQEIVGWVAGPKRVIEIGRAKNVDMQKMIRDYAPDLLHLTSAMAKTVSLPAGIPIVLEREPRDTISSIPAVQYVLVSEPAGASGSTPLLVSIETEDSLASILDDPRVAGIALRGAKEISPGLKDYDHLAGILEKIAG